ncbi:hypothetical protein PTSG_01337 [Salpingoeca rosetta]|uniref:beta-N-acetylhexosaminidase n=1 Tax=Salpingoeca rosetta (strain ATCC 50818 / BSB-021) TaxID=946362 RepID=F2U021_SALR5|nr:uncharacterized protein PTSG_01337 [Salpingoeca rosetta]EGD80749.1 hypothetical protein PTSG_01337 [Salpingoeca rosetta]|eukprot:XP_004997310.1 hypothetical protein PTSG_01337 [Salpingoeca rosetta]
MAMVSVLVVAACVVVLSVVGVRGYQDDGTRAARPWPPVKTWNKSASGSVATLNPCTFVFTDKSAQPSGVERAIDLYKHVIFGNAGPCTSEDKARMLAGGDVLTGIEITAQHPIPGVAKNHEDYALEIPAGGTAMLTATSYEGVLRGLETFSQLVLHSALQPNDARTWHVADVPLQIEDAPTFGHRGLLIDVARTFLPVPVIKTIIDGMMYSKLNILHVHLTDSQAFPLQLHQNPEITFHGAQSADMVYSQDDFRELIQYATDRGVRVYPEIDSPGHTRAMGLAPTLHDIVSCANVSNWGKCCNEPPCGQLNIASQHMMQVLRNVTSEVAALFSDEYFHLGYDEINFNCWKQDASVQRYLKEHNVTINELLLTFFKNQRDMLHDVAPAKKRLYWEEASKQNPPLPLDKSTIVQVWGPPATLHEVLNDTDSDVIVSTSTDFYLDCGLGNMFGQASWCDPYKTWWHMYSHDILANVSKSDASRILGGESCSWGELAGPDNSLVRIFPRASAYGARLWQYANTVSQREANLRIADHAERLSRRGIPVSGTTLQYCRLYPDMCYGFLDNKQHDGNIHR